MKKKEDIFFATIYYLKINHKLIQQKILNKIHPLLSFSFMLQVKYHHKDSGPYFISIHAETQWTFQRSPTHMFDFLSFKSHSHDTQYKNFNPFKFF